MGHHIDDNGDFQSDRHPDLAPNEIILSLKDPTARKGLYTFADEVDDKRVARDIFAGLINGKFPGKRPPELPLHKTVLSFGSPAARKALRVFADETDDRELAEDIVTVLRKWEGA